MPYLLADEWFEAKLNSVSLSFQRQMMGKNDPKKESKRKEEASKAVSSPSTRARAAAAAGTQLTVTADVHGDPKKKKSSRKGSEASSDRGSSRSRMVVKSVALDIPNIIMRMMERMAKVEQPADIVKTCPPATSSGKNGRSATMSIISRRSFSQSTGWRWDSKRS